MLILATDSLITTCVNVVLYGVVGDTLLWSYLTDRKQKCYVNDLSSSGTRIFGVHQGSIQAPLAVDTNIYLRSKSLFEFQDLMNSELIKLNSWLETNKLGLNIAKTEFMINGFRQRLATQGNIDLKVFVDNPI